MRLGGWEIVIVLVIVLLLFGPGRIAKVAGEMGKSIKAFKDGLTSDKEDERRRGQSAKQGTNSI